VIHSKEREIIRNVVVCCVKEVKDTELSVPIQKATEQAMLYTGVFKPIICGIRRKIQEDPGTSMTSPRKQK
jgi:hypothetical protein